MAIEESGIARIDALFAALGSDVGADVLDQALRRLLPGIECRHCEASDVLEEPFREAGTVDLHFLDTSSPCIRVTAGPAEATAILLASKVSA